ncbi:TetR/AcrR family transcriptional regulator [Kribbella sp. NPDC004536]|uniref:TetR/AcrR family transcriptional regulator n=1 Tax=Kribbella sp. NPDC004536 TaxID=3364106 RepID=UPI0036C02793
MASDEPRQQRRSPRRAPHANDRGRAADLTREKILTAALAEFGAKGYAGARTAGIASRAGVNQQLIAYYFGGKQGVIDELRRRASSQQDDLAQSDATFAESLRHYLDTTLDQPDWARLVVWQALGDDPGQPGNSSIAAHQQRMQQGVARIRSLQQAGKLTDTVSPEFVVLLEHLIAFAPLALPQIVRGLFDVDPLSPEYRDLCHEQLLRLLGNEPANRSTEA